MMKRAIAPEFGPDRVGCIHVDALVRDAIAECGDMRLRDDF